MLDVPWSIPCTCRPHACRKTNRSPRTVSIGNPNINNSQKCKVKLAVFANSKKLESSSITCKKCLILFVCIYFCSLSISYCHVRIPRTSRGIQCFGVTVDFLKSPSSCSFSTRRTEPAGRKTFPTWLPPISATQKRVAALQPIRVPLDIPWGPNCQSMRNET